MFGALSCQEFFIEFFYCQVAMQYTLFCFLSYMYTYGVNSFLGII